MPTDMSVPSITFVPAQPTDAIEAFLKTVCQAYPEERINDLAWLLNEFNTPLAHPISYSVPYSCLPEGTCMVPNTLFAPNIKEQPTIVVNSIIAMEMALPTRQTVLTEDSVPHFASTITVQLWARLGVLCRPAVPFNYAHNRTSKTEEDCEFVYPAMTGYINNGFMYKAEYHAWSMDAARAEILEKCIEFNFMNHGKMTAIPVCVAAGTYMQFGLLDLRTNAFFAGNEYDVRVPIQRARAVHASLKVFKMIASIAALKLPEPAIPFFRAIG